MGIGSARWRRGVAEAGQRLRGPRLWAVAAVGVAGLLTPMAAFGDHGGGDSRTTTTTTTTTTGGPAASFQGLGVPAGGQAFGLGVSGDGKVAVGYMLDSANVEHAFRWTAATGTQFLTNTLGGQSDEAHAASSDGSIVAGIA